MVQIKPFQGGEFNQVQTTDYVPELQRGYEKYNRSVDRAEGFARQNDDRLIKMAGQSWEALAELSGSLQKFVGEKVKDFQGNLEAHSKKVTKKTRFARTFGYIF